MIYNPCGDCPKHLLPGNCWEGCESYAEWEELLAEKSEFRQLTKEKDEQEVDMPECISL